MSVVEATRPLSRIALPGRYGATGPAPLAISLPKREIVQLAARRGREGDLAAAVGFALPGPGRAVTIGDRTIIWQLPGIWAVSAPAGAEGSLARALVAAAGTAAAVIDQTHGRCTIRIAGARVRDVLAKGCRLDLHPVVFPEDSATATTIAHLGCTLHHCAPDAFELTVMATFAQPFWEWLTGAAAEYGYTVG